LAVPRCLHRGSNDPLQFLSYVFFWYCNFCVEFLDFGGYRLAIHALYHTNDVKLFRT
jgi:hypothetical protein